MGAVRTPAKVVTLPTRLSLRHLTRSSSPRPRPCCHPHNIHATCLRPRSIPTPSSTSTHFQPFSCCLQMDPSHKLWRVKSFAIPVFPRTEYFLSSLLHTEYHLNPTVQPGVSIRILFNCKINLPSSEWQAGAAEIRMKWRVLTPMLWGRPG